MRLATFNLLHGRALDGSDSSLDDLLVACTSLRADVLCLQEVDRGQPRSGGVDQTAAVADAMGAPSWRFQPAIVGEPGGDWRAADDDDDCRDTVQGSTGVAATAAYGVGLISRWPVTRWRVLRLPAARVRSPVYVPGYRAVILLADEPRVALVAELETPGGPLAVATTHLSFVPGWNLVQLRRLTRDLAAHPGPCVMLGDLNVPGPFPRWASRWRSLARVPTFPADRPALQIDHVLANGPVPEVATVEAHRLSVSDHRAIVVELRARAPERFDPGV
ncbi:MAG: endonuclease/exonuclease/phosphatase family protein [Acidimicrobiales bacterium]